MKEDNVFLSASFLYALLSLLLKGQLPPSPNPELLL